MSLSSGAKRIAILVGVLSLVMLGVGPNAYAQTPPGPVTYQGALSSGDLPAEGLYDFEFKLLDGAGNPVGAPVIKQEVEVRNGLFWVELDFGAGVAVDATYRLDVAVREGVSEGGFTPLAAGSPLAFAAAPELIGAAAVNQPGEVQANPYGYDSAAPLNGVYVTANGNMGVGSINPQARLHLAGNLLFDQAGSPVVYLGSSTGELNRYVQVINSPQSSTAGGLKTGGLLVADSYAYANPAKNYLIVKGYAGIGTAAPQNRLHVVAEGAAEGIRVESGNNVPAIRFVRTGDVTGAYDVSITGGRDASGGIGVYTNNPESGERLRVLRNGNVGIATSAPQYRLHVVADGPASGILVESGRDVPGIRFARTGDVNGIHDVTIDSSPESALRVHTYDPLTTLRFSISRQGNARLRGNANTLALEGTDHTYIEFYPDGPQQRKAWLGYTHQTTNDLSMVNQVSGADIRLESSGNGRVIVAQRLGSPANSIVLNPATGRVSVRVLEITGGDLAEPFAIAESDIIEPGMVVAIDPDNPGQMRLSTAAYDRTVAGVISGAGGIEPGVLMYKDGASENTHPVALTGRVYVYADASNGAIEPGDLLTTADTPGHAMKVTDHERAQGAILGKAMSKLEEGTGLVLLLVTLQ